jgi:hypothetical protein
MHKCYVQSLPILAEAVALLAHPAAYVDATSYNSVENTVLQLTVWTDQLPKPCNQRCVLRTS